MTTLETASREPAGLESAEVGSGGEAISSIVDSLLREAARIPDVRLDVRDRVIANRYRLAESLGRGAHGRVWDAEDLITGERVALKILTAQLDAAEARVRREIGALRLLRLPGVVRLLDEGIEDDRAFLVMERVHGLPFPGVPTPAPWPRVASAAVALLETLARVHAVGMIHRDLKPANILVDAAGRLTILDFGLARPVTPFDEGITGVNQVLGTPAYLAPEQLRAEQSGPATDLYAVGVILYHALSGRFPQAVDEMLQMCDAPLPQPAPPLRSAAPEVPAPVAEIVDRLLAIDPAERPRSATEVLEALLGRTTEPMPALSGLANRAAGSEPLDERALREIFAGPDRLFHIPEDAASALHRRTQGISARVADEVAAWVRAGIARRTGDRIAIDHEAIDRLEAGQMIMPATSRRGEPTALPRLFHLISADDDSPQHLREIAAEASDLARRLAAEGRLGWAAAAVVDGLRAARRGGHPSADETIPLLSLAVEIALAEGTQKALDHALYEVVRIEPRTATTDQLAALVRAALAIGHRTGRALAALSVLPPFADPALELRRQGLRVLAARACPIEQEEAVLTEVSHWVEASGYPAARAAHAGWLGRLRYRQGRFAEAAALHAESAAGERWATAKLAALLSSASARMEAFQLEDVAACAGEAFTLARRYRLPLFEARAEWIRRAAAYRMDAAGVPDRELVEAALLLGPCDIEAMICLNEAAVAFRAGDLGVTRALAGHASRVWASLGERAGGGLLAVALELAGGAGAQDEQVNAIVERAFAGGSPGVGIQVLGLVALAGRAPPFDRERVNALAAQVSPDAWACRLDVLSVREALDLTTPACRSL